ncbi:NUMOD4 motif-containing HNH endonuclease [Mycobacterium palustre]|uniref:HNH nuclease domain-containing protein n=1 Tax=Mycobacterium palustre TaxID=153971 RepID=A0A1X1ZC05_9MYCO|nr:NUMOD4 motif-containing HNH endonuclease [Mycobacterium palustre]MCV7100052.1 HNH endonuclease [Mycobacterium palustre]ORW20933.1 hypothetical protein AWC19_14310 [Mycobacterium palustre]
MTTVILERWLSIPGWEGFYEVSDLGRVRSVDRVIVHPISGPSALKGRILKQSPTSDGGHLVVTLVDSIGGRRRVAKVHHLVLEAFVGPRPHGMESCHRNDIGTDNSLTNLRWDTRSSNVRDQIRNGRHRNNLPNARKRPAA